MSSVKPDYVRRLDLRHGRIEMTHGNDSWRRRTCQCSID